MSPTSIVLRPAEPVVSHPSHPVGVFDDALLLTEAKMAALATHELLVVNFDIGQVLAAAERVTLRVAPFRQRIVSELPSFDIECIDCLPQYARALVATHIHLRIAQRRPHDLSGVLEDIATQYKVLWADTMALVVRGLIDGRKLTRLKGCRRRNEKVIALAALASFLRSSWPQIQGRTALTWEEIERAESTVSVATYAQAYQKQPLLERQQRAERRQRAFTVFANAYTNIRDAIRYLCKDKATAAQIVPTLYPRAKRKRRAKMHDTSQS